MGLLRWSSAHGGREIHAGLDCFEMLRIQRERERRLRYQAKQLANTGRFGGWPDIEKALTSKGRKLVPEALQGRIVRFTLNARCAHARRRNEVARERGD